MAMRQDIADIRQSFRTTLQNLETISDRIQGLQQSADALLSDSLHGMQRPTQMFADGSREVQPSTNPYRRTMARSNIMRVTAATREATPRPNPYRTIVPRSNLMNLTEDSREAQPPTGTNESPFSFRQLVEDSVIAGPDEYSSIDFDFTEGTREAQLARQHEGGFALSNPLHFPDTSPVEGSRNANQPPTGTDELPFRFSQLTEYSQEARNSPYYQSNFFSGIDGLARYSRFGVDFTEGSLAVQPPTSRYETSPPPFEFHELVEGPRDPRSRPYRQGNYCSISGIDIPDNISGHDLDLTEGSRVAQYGLQTPCSRGSHTLAHSDYLPDMTLTEGARNTRLASYHEGGYPVEDSDDSSDIDLLEGTRVIRNGLAPYSWRSNEIGGSFNTSDNSSTSSSDIEDADVSDFDLTEGAREVQDGSTALSPSSSDIDDSAWETEESDASDIENFSTAGTREVQEEIDDSAWETETSDSSSEVEDSSDTETTISFSTARSSTQDLTEGTRSAQQDLEQDIEQDLAQDLEQDLEHNIGRDLTPDEALWLLLGAFFLVMWALIGIFRWLTGLGT